MLNPDWSCQSTSLSFFLPLSISLSFSVRSLSLAFSRSLSLSLALSLSRAGARFLARALPLSLSPSRALSLRGQGGGTGGSHLEGWWQSTRITKTVTRNTQVETRSTDILGKEFESKISGHDVYCTNALLSLLHIMLCSKVHCQKVLNWNSFSIRSRNPGSISPPRMDGRAAAHEEAGGRSRVG